MRMSELRSAARSLTNQELGETRKRLRDELQDWRVAAANPALSFNDRYPFRTRVGSLDVELTSESQINNMMDIIDNACWARRI